MVAGICMARVGFGKVDVKNNSFVTIFWFK